MPDMEYKVQEVCHIIYELIHPTSKYTFKYGVTPHILFESCPCALHMNL